MMDLESDLVKLFKEAGCYLGGKSKHSAAQLIFRDFLDDYLESVGVRRRVVNPDKIYGVTKVGEKSSVLIEFAVNESRVRVTLGRFDTSQKAKLVYDAVNAHRSEIISRLKGVEGKAEQDAIVNSYIPNHLIIEKTVKKHLFMKCISL